MLVLINPPQDCAYCCCDCVCDPGTVPVPSWGVHIEDSGLHWNSPQLLVPFWGCVNA